VFSGRCSPPPAVRREVPTGGREARTRPRRSRASNGPAERAESGDPDGGEGLHGRLTRASTETIFRVLTIWNPFNREEKRHGRPRVVVREAGQPSAGLEDDRRG